MVSLQEMHCHGRTRNFGASLMAAKFISNIRLRVSGFFATVPPCFRVSLTPGCVIGSRNYNQEILVLSLITIGADCLPSFIQSLIPAILRAEKRKVTRKRECLYFIAREKNFVILFYVFVYFINLCKIKQCSNRSPRNK